MKLISLMVGIAASMFLLVPEAFAAVPNYSFAANTLGVKDPAWVTILNAFFWLILGLIIVALILEIFRRPWVRERYTSAEYNEAIGLRRKYVTDQADKILIIDMPVGTALYIIGVVAVERIFALGIIGLIVYAAVS